MRPEVKQKLESLNVHFARLADTGIADLFDDNRFEAFSAQCGDILFDYSKTLIDSNARQEMLDLLTAANFDTARQAFKSGEPINTTEGRAVQHIALRVVDGRSVVIDGQDVMPDVLAVRKAMAKFSDGVRDGSIAGQGGAFTDIVNIGIGGSDLGPAMATLAMAPYHDGPRTHFVSNIDGADISNVLNDVNPATTLFIVASKTFTTQETMTNAKTARDWVVQHLGENAVPSHFAALSTALDKIAAFGIAKDRAFGFWDWVGGRYSVWSAIGLSLMIAIGSERFDEFLAGAASADDHFFTSDPLDNLPVLMALIGAWHRNVCGYETQAILPYDNNLARFPAYLQQLDMESNGKRATKDGSVSEAMTGPIVWGEPGTNGQHAFYQLIHQGTSVVPCDFLIAANAHNLIGDHHEKLVANAFAQTEALMIGKSEEQAFQDAVDSGMNEETARTLAIHKTFTGNRPSCTFLYPKLTPFVLGQLIALYEHKVFTQGVIWNVNSFDQWGVELGKELAGQLLPLVKGEKPQPDRNGSTRGLLSAFHAMRSKV